MSSLFRSPPAPDRIPGVPGHHKLGASRNEALAVALGALILAIIFVAFWFEATH